MPDVEAAFLSPQAPWTSEIVVKKSRFIADLFPVMDVQTAEAHLAEVKSRHKTASHHCYAYSIGQGVPVERFSDDGEPSGTAGKPILEIVRRKQLGNTLLVVTRYFGGTLLGASGLVHAYQDAALAVVEGASLLRYEFLCSLDITCDYGVFGKIEYELGRLGRLLYDRDFTDVIRFGLWVREDETPDLVQKLADWSGGLAHVTQHAPQLMGLDASGMVVPPVLIESGGSE